MRYYTTICITVCKIASVDLSSEVRKGQHISYMELYLLRDSNIATFKVCYGSLILPYTISSFLQIKAHEMKDFYIYVVFHE